MQIHRTALHSSTRSLLTWLLQYIFSETPTPPTGPIFNTIGPRIMGLFPLILMMISGMWLFVLPYVARRRAVRP